MRGGEGGLIYRGFIVGQYVNRTKIRWGVGEVLNCF